MDNLEGAVPILVFDEASDINPILNTITTVHPVIAQALHGNDSATIEQWSKALGFNINDNCLRGMPVDYEGKAAEGYREEDIDRRISGRSNCPASKSVVNLFQNAMRELGFELYGGHHWQYVSDQDAFFLTPSENVIAVPEVLIAKITQRAPDVRVQKCAPLQDRVTGSAYGHIRTWDSQDNHIDKSRLPNFEPGNYEDYCKYISRFSVSFDPIRTPSASASSQSANSESAEVNLRYHFTVSSTHAVSNKDRVDFANQLLRRAAIDKIDIALGDWNVDFQDHISEHMDSTVHSFPYYHLRSIRYDKMTGASMCHFFRSLSLWKREDALFTTSDPDRYRASDFSIYNYCNTDFPEFLDNPHITDPAARRLLEPCQAAIGWNTMQLSENRWIDALLLNAQSTHIKWLELGYESFNSFFARKPYGGEFVKGQRPLGSLTIPSHYEVQKPPVHSVNPARRWTVYIDTAVSTEEESPLYHHYISDTFPSDHLPLVNYYTLTPLSAHPSSVPDGQWHDPKNPLQIPAVDPDDPADAGEGPDVPVDPDEPADSAAGEGPEVQDPDDPADAGEGTRAIQDPGDPADAGEERGVKRPKPDSGFDADAEPNQGYQQHYFNNWY